jgi:hypothetical protein
MANITSDLRISSRATSTGTGDTGTPIFTSLVEVTSSQASGTTSGKQDLLWEDTGTAAISTPVDIDLAGSLTDKFGVAVVFAEITRLTIKNNETGTGKTLTVGAGSSPWISWLKATGDAIVIAPGGTFVLDNPLDGYPVTATTADILRLDPGANSVNYTIQILGRSA